LLSDMVRSYPDLVVTHENGSSIWVSPKPKGDAADG